jgi:hypothetical protein
MDHAFAGKGLPRNGRPHFLSAIHARPNNTPDRGPRGLIAAKAHSCDRQHIGRGGRRLRWRTSKGAPSFMDQQETTMTTKITLTVLAAATLAAASLLAGTASAKAPTGLHAPTGQSHSTGGTLISCGIGGCTQKKGSTGGTLISCGIGGCTETKGSHPIEKGHGPVIPPGWRHADHDHDYGWRYRDGYRFGWPYQSGIQVDVVAPVVAAPAPVEAVQAATQAPCNCLAKQNMPDGSVLFQDICTKESWVVAPRTVGAR